MALLLNIQQSGIYVAGVGRTQVYDRQIKHFRLCSWMLIIGEDILHETWLGLGLVELLKVQPQCNSKSDDSFARLMH
jgi:hypothetical protein